MIWFASFVKPPNPSGPSSVMVLPIAWKIGSTWSKTALSPPTMIESAASIAPCSPPDTGASSIFTPLAASALPTFCDTIGEIVDMSAKISPGFAPSMMPSLPSATSSTSGEFGSIVMRTSDCAATSRGVPADFAPAPTSSSTGPRLRLWTTSGYPALRRFLAMGRPMIPRPMNPITCAMAPPKMKR